MLQRRREHLGWTQDTLATKAGLSTDAVSAIERGTRRFPQRETVRRLVEALGLAGAEREAFLALVPRAVRRRAAKGTPDSAGAVVPRQLPAGARDFTGRDDQLRELTDLLSRPPAQHGPVVATLAGMGGIGKTALAVQAGHAVAEHYPDGQLYVDLRGYGPGEPMSTIDALSYLLRALGTPTEEIPLETDEAAARFRTALATRRVLLIVDNSRDVAQVRPLLPGTAGSAVIATSRRSLSALPGRLHFRLGGLPHAEGLQMLRALAGTEKVDAELEAAGEVIRHCGALPLGLRMAGARLAARPEWPISHLAQRLRDERVRLDELSRDDVSVRTSFAVSINQLAGSADPSDRRAAEVFTMLGILDGPDIAVTVAARLVQRPERETELTLERLVDLNLVEAPAPGRYRLHDLLRVYARERAAAILSESGRAAALTRVLDLYAAAAWRTLGLVQPNTHRLSLAETSWTDAAPELDDLGAAMAWLDRERPHLLSIVRQGLGTADVSGDLVVRLVLGLFGYYATSRHWPDWAQVARAPIEAGVSTSNRALMSLLRNDLGLALARLAEAGSGSFDDAVTELRRSLADFRSIGDPARESMCLANLTLVLDLAGRLAEAIDYGERGLQLARALGDVNAQAIAIGNLGKVYGRAGDRDREISYLQESLRLLERAGGAQHQAEVLELLAAAYGESGRMTEAIASLERSASLYEQAGDPLGVAGALTELGALHLRLGNPTEALARLEDALVTAEQHDNDRTVAGILRQLAGALQALGRDQEAEQRLLAALAIFGSRNMAAAGKEVRVQLERLRSGRR